MSYDDFSFGRLFSDKTKLSLSTPRINAIPPFKVLSACSNLNTYAEGCPDGIAFELMEISIRLSFSRLVKELLSMTEQRQSPKRRRLRLHMRGCKMHFASSSDLDLDRDQG